MPKVVSIAALTNAQGSEEASFVTFEDGSTARIAKAPDALEASDLEAALEAALVARIAVAHPLVGVEVAVDNEKVAQAVEAARISVAEDFPHTPLEERAR